MSRSRAEELLMNEFQYSRERAQFVVKQFDKNGDGKLIAKELGRFKDSVKQTSVQCSVLYILAIVYCQVRFQCLCWLCHVRALTFESLDVETILVCRCIFRMSRSSSHFKVIWVKVKVTGTNKRDIRALFRKYIKYNEIRRLGNLQMPITVTLSTCLNCKILLADKQLAP